MTNGRHEDPAGQNGWARVKAQAKYRAKALLAAGTALVAQEAVLLLTDTQLQEGVQQALPGYAFLVPVVFSAIVGAITHQVRNGPDPRQQPEQKPSDGSGA